MKRGFTLIELLAVIVILALIAIIATPLITNVIDQAKKGAFKDSVYGLIKSAELDYAKAIYNNKDVEVLYTYSNGVESANVEGRTLAYKGAKPKSGNIIVNAEGQIAVALYNGTYCAEKGFGEIDITLTDKMIDECKLSASQAPVNTFVEFNYNFGGTSNDYFRATDIASDGYVAVGYSMSNDGNLVELNQGGTDAFITKYDISGNIEWVKNYGGSSTDNFYSVIATSDGYIAVGHSDSIDGNLSGLNKGQKDAIIVKYDMNGNIIWNKNFGGTNSDFFNDIASVSDGYIVIGHSSSTDGDLSGVNNGNADAIIVKYDVNGNVVWEKSFGGTNNEYFRAVDVNTTSIIVAGSSMSNDGDLSGLNYNGSDAIIVKYDLSGNVVWKKNYGGSSNDFFYDVKSVDNNYIVTGYSDSADYNLTGLKKGGYDSIIVKYDQNGNRLWNKNFGGSGIDVAYTIDNSINGFFIAGYSSSTNEDLIGLNKGGNDAFITKYNLDGDIVWQNTYGGSGSDYFFNISSKENNYIGVGYSQSSDDDLVGLSKGGYDGIILTRKIP